MKKYLVVKADMLNKILDCFSSEQEFMDFGNELGVMIEEIVFASQLAGRNLEDKAFQNEVVLKQYFLLGLFLRNNIDTIHDLVRVIDYEEITEEDKKKLEEQIEIEVDEGEEE
jgi:hypothetical protein